MAEMQPMNEDSEDMSVPAWAERDCYLVNRACTKWLKARGLITTMSEVIHNQSQSARRYKTLRREKRKFEDECRAWDSESE